MIDTLPELDELKRQARRLRAALQANGTPISHGMSLELLARQLGHRNWNTLHAAVGSRPPASPVVTGKRVRGRYLGQTFEGEVIGVVALTPPGRFRITVHFDEPVDVVTFESFSAFRRRVTCVIDRSGMSTAKTSDGRPHMQLQI